MATLRSGLRARLQRGETIVAPGAYDPLSARVVQALGFSAVYTGGYMTGAHTSITEPLLTLTEQVEVAHKVARAVDLPALADAGAGYGDPLHVMRSGSRSSAGAWRHSSVCQSITTWKAPRRRKAA